MKNTLIICKYEQIFMKDEIKWEINICYNLCLIIVHVKFPTGEFQGDLVFLYHFSPKVFLSKDSYNYIADANSKRVKLP